MITIIDKNNKFKYNKIYHISDIHIRNTDIHVDEYKHVFNNLYNYLIKVKNDCSLIVITGDILHNKDKLTPLSVSLCVDFLSKLSQIMTTVFIAGNHDLNIRNLDYQDSLSSIIYKRNINNLYYLKHSGVYRFNNILFGLSSLLDNKFISASDIVDDGLKIGLYHGIISNSKNSKGFEFSDKSITKFDNYDLVLLGDMHFHQYLNDEKTIAYASSLISQNFSETDIEHGVLVWDLEDKSSFYQIINNDYRYDEITIKNNGSDNYNIYYHNNICNIDNLILSEKCRLRINTSDMNYTDNYKLLIASIENKYPSITIKHNKLLVAKKEKINNKIVINDSIQDIVIKEIDNLDINIKNDVNDILLLELKSAFENLDEKTNWKLISLEFSNLLTYGPNNKIDFSNLTFDEITGLIGKNGSGKSSLIDILMFSLFNKYSRNYIDSSRSERSISAVIINNKYNDFDTIVSFESNNVIYEIHKSGKRQMKKREHLFDTVKYTNYKLYKYDYNDKINVSGFTDIETQKIINSIIGSYENFCLSTVCLQNNTKNKYDFFEMSSYSRKEFLKHLLTLEIFNDIETKYKTLVAANKKNISFIMNSDDYKNYNLNIENNIKVIKNDIDNYNIHDDELLLDKYKNELQQITFIKEISSNHKYYKYNKQQLSDLLSEQINNLNIYSLPDNNIDNIKNINNQLIKKIKYTNIINDINIDNKIESLHNNINNLKLIKNKDLIISNNILYENNKNTLLIKLKSKLINSNNIIPKSIIPKSIISNLQFIYDNICIEDYTQYINSIKSTLYDLNSLYSTFNIKLHNIKKLINFNIIIDDSIKTKYNNINNYYKYVDDINNILLNYDTIKNTYLLTKSNKDIFNIFDTFNNCINTNCNNCINHSYNIKQFYKNNNINDSYNNIKKQFHKLNKIKKEFLLINNYHLLITYNNISDKITFVETIINHYNDELIFYTNLDLDNQILIQQKNYLLNTINKYNNNNLLFKINQIELSTNIEYIQLMDELQLFDIYTKELTDLTNYKHNLNIYNNIDNNNKLIDIINDIELINNAIYIIDNNELYYHRYSELNYLIDNLIQHINHKKQQYIINNNNYQLLLTQFNKYNDLNKQLVSLEKEQTIFQTIISLTGITGIPRKIINIKLSYVENEVNNIIFPFINKKIIITTDVNDINIYFDDYKNKINFTGGCESFLLSIAFKITLSKFFNVPQCGILFIDEGVSVFDKDNVDKFNIIADFMKKYYNCVILITHISSFNDYISDFIEIRKNKDKTSHILF